MARTERRLDAGDERLLRFAAGLRQLRSDAGGPGYRELSRRVHYSASALADAASGRRLPSLALTLAYVSACGGDAALWERRWRVLAVELATETDEKQGDGAAPYVGLVAFQLADADRFHGRARLTIELARRVSDQRFVVVVGPSGSGKSSLLRAGLVHRARRDGLVGAGGLTVVMTPGPHPLEECAARLAALVDSSPSAVHADLRTDPRCLHLTALRAVVDRPPDSEVLLVVDQFEELFTLCQDEDERTLFLQVLHTAARAANSRTRIVLGLRADFYAHCAHYPHLVAALGQAQVLVGPMSPEELRAVITQPALDAGCRVETALVSQVIAEAVGQPGVLPLVSHALLETWRRRRGTTLTLAGYEAAGGITQSIARTAETVYADLSDEQQRWARQVFLRLVALGEGTEDTKRRVDRAELDVDDPDHGGVLERLARARLVTLGRDSVELTHEALVRCWPRLHRWLTDDREGLRIHRQLTEAATTWRALDGDPGALYRGHRLTRAEQWATSNGDCALSTREQEFLKASLSARAREQAATRRRTWRQRQLLALLTVLLLVAVGVTGYAQRALRAATDQRNLAITQKVLGQATALRAANPALSLQLTLAAYRLAPVPEARGTLLNIFAAPYATRLTQHADVVTALAISSDGRTLVTASGDRTVRLWDISTPHRPRDLATLTGRSVVARVALSPDGQTLVTANADKTVRLWDISDLGRPRQLGSLPGDAAPPYEPMSATFGPDGTLATAGATDTREGIILLWDLTNRDKPRRRAIITGQLDTTVAVAFSPNGRTLAAVNATPSTLSHEVRLWDVSDRTQPREQATLTGFTGHTFAAFHPDGHTLATAHSSVVKLWEVTDLRHPVAQSVLSGPTGAVTAMTFSPHHHTLAAATSDRTVRLWDVTTARQARTLTTLTGDIGATLELAFTPDGQTLASVHADNIVRLDDVAGYAYPTRARGSAYSVAFSPDGRTLATGNTDGTTGLWDAADPYRPRELATLATDVPKGPVAMVAFSPTGRFLATVDGDVGLKLWDINRPSTPAAILMGETDAQDFHAMEFSPDGRTLAASRGDHVAVLWDVTDIDHPQQLATLTGFTGSLYALRFSPTGHVLATGDAESSVTLWDVTDPRNPRKLATVDSPDAGRNRSFAFSPDGHTLAIADSDNAVRLWDSSDPRKPRSLATVRMPSTATELEFSRDGRLLAAGAFDGSVELWDVTDRHRPRDPITLTGSTSGGFAVLFTAFNTDNILATSGTFQFTSGQTLRLWDTNIERIATRVCQLAWPTITPAEWNQYFPGVTYQPPCTPGG